MTQRTLLSFVIPCYRSEYTIEKVIKEIIETTSIREGFDYEIIAVNDCSPDNVYNVLKKLAKDNERIKIVNLVKNVGRHSAILAGYSFVNGDYIVNLDDDYQSPVNNMWKLIDPILSDECDVSTADYYSKKEQVWKRWGSDINLAVTEIMFDKPKGLRFENLSVVKRFVADEIVQYKNPFPYLEGLIYGVTKRIISVPMEQRERGDDKKTGYTFRKSVSLFANVFVNFSIKPLRIASALGMLFALFGFLYGIFAILWKILNPNAYEGWSSIVAIMMFSNGVIMILLGLIGEYVGRILISINRSPQYVIRDLTNIQASEGSFHE